MALLCFYTAHARCVYHQLFTIAACVKQHTHTALLCVLLSHYTDSEVCTVVFAMNDRLSVQKGLTIFWV